ncbi:MAG: hypothetical protein KR126chlam1_01121 [Chlamydiae bacterium]|nr:hypothetical protein [Chlamydiota bacterium]
MVRRLLCLFFFLNFANLSAVPKHYVSICAIFRDEDRFLKEWIEYHRMIGVEHFYLYNHLSEDNYYEVLRPYIKEGIVDLIEWPFQPKNHKDWIQNIQAGTYNKTLKERGEENIWIAFIDTDEFIVMTKGSSLPKFLSDYEEFGGLAIHWQLYGTSGVQRIPENKTMIGTLTKKATPKYHRNKWIKSIIQPKAVRKFTKVHCPDYKTSYFPVDEHTKRCSVSPYKKNISVDLIRINHYTDRDEDFFYNIKMPRRKNRNPVPPKPHPEYNAVEDPIMLQFIPELEKRLLVV